MIRFMYWDVFEASRRFEEVQESRRRSEKFREGWRRSRKVGESQRKLERKCGKCTIKYEKVRVSARKSRF